MPSKQTIIESPPRWYRGANIPMRVIREYVRDVAERFQPEKIILFGSYADGIPHEDSDVDILVVMPCRNAIDQACRIDREFDPPFPLDLIVRSPLDMTRRLKEGDSFLQEIAIKGKVLYESKDSGVGEKSRGRLPLRRQARPKRRAVP